MNLKLATLEYVALKQSMGMRFETEASLLRAFGKQMGDAVAVATVTSKDVLRYLSGRKGGPVTLFWHRKHDALKGFWEFAIRRGYTDRSPVPVRRAKEPVRFIPYIYSLEELKRLLDGATSYQKKWLKLEPVTLRAMLLLLYGAGLRTSEALHLTCMDVDLSAMTVTIRESKFYKTRRIALNAQLCSVLSEYDDNRRQKEHARGGAAPFFTYKGGGAVATTRARARVKRPISVSAIWNLILGSHSPQVYGSWGKAGRCDDAPSGKRPRRNWSHSSRTDHRNSGFS
jgi:site-specific recombinase XerD